MSARPASTLSRLEEIVGSANLTANPAELAAYEVDGVRPSAAARPGSAQEVSEIVHFAAVERLALIPTGGRTKLAIGAPPRRYDLALDLTRLDRVLAYDPRDLTLGVEPGASVAKLRSVLAEHQQMLPLGVPFLNQATVGGTMASGVDSPLRQHYGTARDFVLGMEFVTGEGESCKSGGRVVKNVTGYDLHKLLIGSLGTLAVLTRINFKTFPLPPMSRGFLATFPSLRGAVELRRRIAQSPLSPLTLDILSPQVSQLFARGTPDTDASLAPVGPWFSTSEWMLVAGFGGTERVIARYAADLTRMAEEAQAQSARILGDDERPAVLGRLRECLPLMLQSSPAATILKMSALPEQTEAVLDQVQRIAEQHELPTGAVARGVGVIYVALLPRGGDAQTLQRLAEAANNLMRATAELGAPAVVSWCPLEVKRIVNVWGTTRDDLKLMQRLKQVFDPQGILSPGRFVGGI